MVEVDTAEEATLNLDFVAVDNVVVAVGFEMLTMSSHMHLFRMVDLSQKALELQLPIVRSFDLVADYVALVLRFALTPLPTTNSIPRYLDLKGQDHHYHRLQ